MKTLETSVPGVLPVYVRFATFGRYCAEKSRGEEAGHFRVYLQPHDEKTFEIEGVKCEIGEEMAEYMRSDINWKNVAKRTIEKHYPTDKIDTCLWEETDTPNLYSYSKTDKDKIEPLIRAMVGAVSDLEKMYCHIRKISVSKIMEVLGEKPSEYDIEVENPEQALT